MGKICVRRRMGGICVREGEERDEEEMCGEVIGRNKSIEMVLGC